ncbi:A disintegrin and metalloproteinase with thrombospondin motifs 18-like isoform X2 [Actinia tenebrosa]|nr:A disintegrin and metalloproteinase with thrombospondin motifs 18-like isoform X2 [Actinia tenebrosa]
MAMRIPWVLVLLLAVYIPVGQSREKKHKVKHHVHGRMTRSELEWYFGVSSPLQVSDYEIVSPTLSKADGKIRSYRLLPERRQGRPVEEVLNQEWHYSIPLKHHTLVLKVVPSVMLTHRPVTIETHHSNGTTTNDTIPWMSHCVGHVVSQPGSLVAISNHNGLDGLIRTSHNTWYIRPLSRRLAMVKGLKKRRWERPHIVTRVRRNVPEFLKEENALEASLEKKNEVKREETKHKYMEMAIVADEYAISSIGEKLIPYHLMMLAHLTNAMFIDESIGEKKITVVIIKMVLKKNGFGYRRKASNRDKLNAMNSWAIETFPLDDKDGRHPDVVSLITKGNGGGIAESISTCRKNGFGTTVSNDFGLSTSQIIVHETAHTLGVGHDGDLGCKNGVNIMTTQVTGGKGALRWSSCSRRLIQQFLSGPGSSCLDDVPTNTVHEPHLFKVKLPGQVYDGDAQCRVAYGPKYLHCKQKLSDCGSLWCSTGGATCHSSIAPPMDGTKCGERHWCIRGECVDDGSPMVDGAWSSWSYTKCSHSCGGGVQSKTRTCTNPKPERGGMKCEGIDKTGWRICNSQPCSRGDKTSRTRECEAFSPSYRSYIMSKDPCTLRCMSGATLYSKGRVTDGTRCSGDPNVKDVCVQGICKNVGCDNILESGVKFDRCGKCNGDGTSCKVVKGVYTKDYRRWGLSNADLMFTVPAGSTHIYVAERAKDHNLIGIQDSKGEFLFKFPSNSRNIQAVGTTVMYHSSRSIDKEFYYIKGPTTAELRFVFAHFEYKNPNRGVDYQYFAPGKSVVTADQVGWKSSPWSECSQWCSGGVQNRTVECIRLDYTKSFVNEEVCKQKERKPERIQACNTSPCRAEWLRDAPWRPCSKTCGKGTQIRRTICREQIAKDIYRTVPNNRCRGSPPGPMSRDCNMIDCLPEWTPLEWGKCSKTCAGGLVTRKLACRRLNENGHYMPLAPHMCRHASRPPTQEPCNSDILCSVGSNNIGITPRYRALGCYRDGRPHAVPVYLGSMRSKIIWTNLKPTVDACARLVKQRNPTYQAFGVKFYGECWSGPNVLKTYKEYGKGEGRENCYRGVGTHYTYYVYEFI